MDVKLLLLEGGRWGTLQSAANEDAAMFLWKCTCFIIYHIVPGSRPWAHIKRSCGLGGYTLSLLVHTVIVSCEFNIQYINCIHTCIYIYICIIFIVYFLLLVSFARSMHFNFTIRQAVPTKSAYCDIHCCISKVDVSLPCLSTQPPSTSASSKTVLRSSSSWNHSRDQPYYTQISTVNPRIRSLSQSYTYTIYIYIILYNIVLLVIMDGWIDVWMDGGMDGWIER